jgi:hypothetical protein
MNAALEFHDSEVQLAVGESGELRVVFSAAYMHRSVGLPGVDPGAGYIQPAELVFSGASWVGLSPLCVGPLSDGVLVAGDQSFSLIPVPFNASGQVSAELVFVSGAVLSVSATSVACSCFGKPRFVENYPGSEPFVPLFGRFRAEKTGCRR